MHEARAEGMETGVTDRPQEPAPAVVARVEYTVEPEDYVAGYLFVWEMSLRRRMHKGVIVLVVYATLVAISGAAAVGFAVDDLRHPGLFIIPLMLLMPASSLLIAQACVLIIPVRKYFRRSHFRKVVGSQRRAGILREHRRDCVSLNETGFTEVNEFYEADGGVRITERKEFEVQWPAVESIDVTDRLAVFTVARKGFLFLPRWAFKNEEAFLEFVRTAERLREAAGPGRPAPALALSSGPPDGRLRLPS